MNPAVHSLLAKLRHPQLLEELATLTSSELNSLLLEVLRQEASTVTPSSLMKAYDINRFVAPSAVDGLTFIKEELRLLLLASEHGFAPLELSPLAPIGNCSAIGLADQNKIVSALRGTEVVADATNLMALESSKRRKENKFDDSVQNLCAVHRHVRAQSLAAKGHTAHFKIFCALSAGKDTGGFAFEKQALAKHLLFYKHYLAGVAGVGKLQLIIKGLSDEKGAQPVSKILYEHVAGQLDGIDLSYIEVPLDEHRYYQHTRFTLNAYFNGTVFNLGDGGFVDWGQKLTSNAKERMFTSGLGLELLVKLTSGLIAV